MALSEMDDLRQQLTALSQQLQQVRHELLQLQQTVNKNSHNPAPTEDTVKPAAPSSSTTKAKAAIAHSTVENFIGLKIINLVGIVVLLIGISIGVKYAIDKNLITPFLRIVLAYAASAALLLLSFILRKNYESFSAILFSGAMASMYFTTYGAFTYYSIFSQTLCFIIMAAIAVYTAARSLQYNRQEITIVSMVGAYAIPILISANHENYLLLFSYILVMNAGILVISFKRSWRLLNLIALIITWSFFIGWALFKYRAAYQLYALVFIGIYFILFLLSAFAFTVTKKTRLNNQQLLHVLLNNVAFFIALLAVLNTAASAANAASVSAFCAVLFFLFAIAGNNFFHEEKLLNRIHYATALVLVILWISIQCSGLTITLLWTLLAIIVFIVGIITKTIWPRLAAIMLVGLTLLKLVLLDSLFFTAVQKIIAYITIGTLLLLLSFFYQKFKAVLFKEDENEKRVTP